MLDLGYRELVRYLIKDEEQLKILKMLSERRGFRLRDIVRRGIFAVPDRDELDYLLESWGKDFEGCFGLGVEDVGLVTEGFIIPVLDSSNRVLFYINYNWERVEGRHYINVFPDRLGELKTNIKMFGAHNLEKGLKEGWVVVVEGIFDAIRLESEGIPAVALMGSKLMRYHQLFLERFEKVVYIPDNDTTGEQGWRSVSAGLENVIRIDVISKYKDVDEFALKGKQEYREWLGKLKQHRLRGE